VKGRTVLQIRRYGRYFVILVLLAVIGSVAGGYILLQERLPNPFATFYNVNGAFPSAAAVVPGLGEPVNIAGVHVGEITNTTLQNGQGIIHMQITPSKLPGAHLYRNASAELIPNTPLDDMQIDIQPGTKSTGILPSGSTIPVGQTTSPTQSDDLLDSLDTDTRTWFASLITEVNNATEGRGKDLRELLMNVGPTAQQLRQIGDLLAGRRHELAEVVHNLGVLSQATSVKDGQIKQVIDAGNQTLQAISGQDVALKAAIEKLPGTLQTTRGTLSDLIGFANELGPTATALQPTARRLPTTLREASTVIKGATVLPLNEIPKFESVVLPLGKLLPGLATSLTNTIPSLVDSFKVLNYTTNELAYNPGANNPGFLYWLAWFSHNADSFLSTSDANGPAWRVLLLTDCASFKSFSFGPLLSALTGSTLGCSAPSSTP
jgi:phospholipid/cholesterol/gamma-HCH transport system substrate-binding protein